MDEDNLKLKCFLTRIQRMEAFQSDSEFRKLSATILQQQDDARHAGTPVAFGFNTPYHHMLLGIATGALTVRKLQ